MQVISSLLLEETIAKNGAGKFIFIMEGLIAKELYA